MGKIGKTFEIFLTLIIAMSCLTLLTVKPVNAQSIPAPSVPQFTMQLVGPPFTFNTTYSLDPNSGKIVANIGYTNPYSYVVLTIKNQPFNLSYGSLYYNVRIKNQNTITPNENWTVISWGEDNPNPEQTTGSEYTNISLNIEGQGLPSLAGTQTDIQVQAMLGSYSYERTGLLTYWGYTFTGVTSGWSNSQTISVPANVPLNTTPTSSTSTPTSTPTSTSYSSSPSTSFLLITNTISLTVIAILLAVIIALLLLLRKRKPLS